MVHTVTRLLICAYEYHRFVFLYSLCWFSFDTWKLRKIPLLKLLPYYRLIDHWCVLSLNFPLNLGGAIWLLVVFVSLAVIYWIAGFIPFFCFCDLKIAGFLYGYNKHIQYVLKLFVMVFFHFRWQSTSQALGTSWGTFLWSYTF